MALSVYLYVLPTGGAGIGVVVVTVLKLGGNVIVSFSKGGLSFAGWNSPYVFYYICRWTAYSMLTYH